MRDSGRKCETVYIAVRGRPSLALLALMMPILGTGFAPSLVALTLLALPPILINTIAGIIGVERDIVDAARGMGMTARDILRRIEPVGAPLSPDAVNGLLAALCRRAGLDRPVTPHQLRHAFGSNLVDAGGGILLSDSGSAQLLVLFL